jgi:nucleotide-binding universal stress UspA family protein
MYRNVLVGVDQRDGSRDAAVLARSLAPHCERLSLVNVRNKYYPGMRGLAPDTNAAEEDYSLGLLRRIRDEFSLDAETLSVAATGVGAGIKAAAETIGADLIVVGSCHRSALGRVVSGNDAVSMLHHAPCAVAIAPRGYADGHQSIDMIGVAYDGSPQSTGALAEARLLARDVAARVKALDVEQITISKYGWVAPYVESRDILIANARRRLGDLGSVELDVAVGLPNDDLTQFSDEVDVLICGSRARGTVKRVMLGSISDHLVRHARSPLVIVPAITEATDANPTKEDLAPTNA